MASEFNHLNAAEKLKAENEFLKMKLMLETGAKFGGMSSDDLPPEIENEFLLSVAEFERQAENMKYIQVFEKLRRPTFKPVAEIADDEIDDAWEKLLNELNRHAISLEVCSPNISNRELYRFTVEELFLEEMGDMDIPGMMTNFIYDEFHPDIIYDNSRMVQQNLAGNIFTRSPFFFKYDFDGNGFTFNGKQYISVDEFENMLERFKSLFDEIRLRSCKIDNCTVTGKQCEVTGFYEASAESGGVVVIFKGPILVTLQESRIGWVFTNIEMGGFDPDK